MNSQGALVLAASLCVLALSRAAAAEGFALVWSQVCQPSYSWGQVPLVADLDGDGKQEVVFRHTDRAFVFRQEGGTYRIHDYLGWMNGYGGFEAVKDIGGDGSDDLVRFGLDKPYAGRYFSGFPFQTSGPLLGTKDPGMSVLAMIDVDADGKDEFLGIVPGKFQIKDAQTAHLDFSTQFEADGHVIGQIDEDNPIEFGIRFGHRMTVFDGRYRTIEGRYDLRPSEYPLQMADVTGDRRGDLICSDGSSRLTVRDAKSGRLLYELSPPNTELGSLVVRDVDRDGVADMALASKGSTPQIKVIDGRSGFVKRTVTFPGTVGIANFLFANTDADASIEVIAVGSPLSRPQLLVCDFDAGLVEYASLRQEGDRDGAAFGDVNGDGKTDIVAWQDDHSQGWITSLVAYLGPNYSLAKQYQIHLDSGSYRPMTVAQCDNDLQSEIIAPIRDTDGVRIAVVDGKNGAVQARSAILPYLSDPIKVEAADVDNDGTVELVVAVQSLNTGLKKLIVYSARTGAKERETPDLPYSKFDVLSMSVGQGDADSQLEVAVSGEYLRVYDGKALALQVNIAVPWTRAVGFADQNLDGKPELISIDNESRIKAWDARTGGLKYAVGQFLRQGVFHDGIFGLTIADFAGSRHLDFLYFERGTPIVVYYNPLKHAYESYFPLLPFNESVYSVRSQAQLGDTDGNGRLERMVSTPYGLTTFEVQISQ